MQSYSCRADAAGALRPTMLMPLGQPLPGCRMDVVSHPFTGCAAWKRTLCLYDESSVRSTFMPNAVGNFALKSVSELTLTNFLGSWVLPFGHYFAPNECCESSLHRVCSMEKDTLPLWHRLNMKVLSVSHLWPNALGNFALESMS